MKLNWNRYNFICILLTALTLWGCEKEPEKGSGSPILFGLEGLEVTSKAALTQGDFDSGSKTVYVYGRRNNTLNALSSSIASITRYPTGLWYTANRDEWDSGTYTFRGMASSVSINPSSNLDYTGTVSTPGIAVYNSGMSINVNQPDSYDESGMIDYLLSRTFSVSDGNTKPIVKLQMEHTMPAVEIYIVKSEFLYGACLDSLVLTGVYSSGIMTCFRMASYGDPLTETHSWTTTPSNNSNVYLRTGTLASQVTIGDTRGSTDAYMKLIMMPQQLTPNAKLTVKYWVNERAASSAADNYVSYKETFQLYNYVPQSWISAHRVIYTLTVDTGIHLVGSIAPWKNVDFIEGTILPDVNR